MIFWTKWASFARWSHSMSNETEGIRMRERFIDTSRGRIWCSVHGEEAGGVPLLVLHGGPGFQSMPQTVSDLAKDRPVYFYDQLGCGKSDRPADFRYSLKNYIEELDEVKSALKLQEVVLMAFSWGCALTCAYMLEKRPDGVKGLILSGPLLSSPLWEKDQRENIATMPEPVIQAIDEGERSQEYTGAYQSAMMDYYKKFVCRMNPWPDSLQAAFESLNMEVYLSMWGPSEFTVTGQLKDLDLSPRLSEISVPVLLTCGDSDEAGVKTLKDFQMAFPNACLSVIPRSGHMHHIEQPEIYKAAVQSYLKEL